MGRDAEKARKEYAENASTILIDAFNEGYQMGMHAAEQIYN